MLVNKDLAKIRKAMQHVSIDWAPTEFLDTQIPGLNTVLGDEILGLTFGNIIEIFGWESSAKTTIALAIAALAQRADAYVVWGDVENSFTSKWALKRGILPCPDCKGTGRTTRKTGVKGECLTCTGEGIDLSKIMVIQPTVGRFKTEKDTRLSTAQELCEEIEMGIKLKVPQKKKIVVLDSIAALLTEEESDAGLVNASMHSNLALPKFLGRLLRRWVGLAQVHNCIIILINQLREGPKGKGPKTPGGNAPRFYAHVRVRATRVFGSKIVDKGKVVGIKGVLVNKKNKAGGGEGTEIGYRLKFAGSLEFLPAKEVKKREGGGEEEEE